MLSVLGGSDIVDVDEINQEKRKKEEEGTQDCTLQNSKV